MAFLGWVCSKNAENSTDSQSKVHAETVSKLYREATNALAEALDLCFEAEDKVRAMSFYPITRL